MLGMLATLALPVALNGCAAVLVGGWFITMQNA
jgi:hypothetical protein